MARLIGHPHLRSGALQVSVRPNTARFPFSIFNFNLPLIASAGGS